MKVTFFIPEEDPNLEIPIDIPSIPNVDDCVTLDGRKLYRISSIVH